MWVIVRQLCDISGCLMAFFFFLSFYVPHKQGHQKKSIALLAVIHHWDLLVDYFIWGAACLPQSLRGSCSAHSFTSTVNIQQSNPWVSRGQWREIPPWTSLLTRVPTLVSQDLCRASSLRTPGADSRKSIRWLSFRRMSCTSITPPLGETQNGEGDEKMPPFSTIKLRPLNPQ